MKILYVSYESPLRIGGGIATYLKYAAEAMVGLGHEVFLYTWGTMTEPLLYNEVFTSSNTLFEAVDKLNVWESFPAGPYNHGFSHIISDKILKLIRELSIDIVEATDYLSPALMLFQKIGNGELDRPVVRVTYNHGLIEESYLAAQNVKSLYSAADLAGERQQCRISDIVLAPSKNAATKLKQYGISENVHVVPAPFLFKNAVSLRTPLPCMTHIGRVSIAKGIDKTVLLANIVNDDYPLDRIGFIGRLVDTPYNMKDITAYIRKRLSPSLASKVFFSGEQTRDVALSFLRAGDIAPHLSLSETFSYAFLETLNAGLLPIAEAGSAVAEFYPAELQRYLLDPRFSDINKQRQLFQSSVRDASAIVETLQSYNSERSDPNIFAHQLSEKYSSILAGHNIMKDVLRHKEVDDITILMPIFKPNHEFYEAIDSIAAQTLGVPKVLICDDGNSLENQRYFDYAALVLSDVKIVRQPNSGLLAARNTLIHNCKSDLAIFLDADDILVPQCVEKMLAAYNNSNGASAVLPMRKNFYESDEAILRVLLGDHVHLLSNDYRMTALCEVEILRKIGFDASRRNGEADDWIFWLDFTRLGHRAATVPEFLFRYRFKTGTMSWPWSEGQRVGTQLMLREVLDKTDSPALGATLGSLAMFLKVTEF